MARTKKQMRQSGIFSLISRRIYLFYHNIGILLNDFTIFPKQKTQIASGQGQGQGQGRQWLIKSPTITHLCITRPYDIRFMIYL